MSKHATNIIRDLLEWLESVPGGLGEQPMASIQVAREWLTNAAQLPQTEQVLADALRGAITLFAHQCHRDCTLMNWLDRAEAALAAPPAQPAPAVQPRPSAQWQEVHTVLTELMACSHADPSRKAAAPRSGRWVTVNVPSDLWQRLTALAHSSQPPAV